MKIMVTGGTGFIGSHIVDLLIKNNYDVCVIDNLSHSEIENINPKAKFYKCDILDPTVYKIFEVEKPDIVVHEAAQISNDYSISNPIKDASINIIGTLNLLESAKNVKAKKFIYASSAAVFGEPSYLPIDENHSLNMISNYGVSKHTPEHYLNVYRKLYNIPYCVLRYSNVYGPRQLSSSGGGVVSIFCNKIIKNQPPYIYGDGKQIRDFVYVKDVARANLLAIKNTCEGIFNVCSGQKISINELFKIIASILNKKLQPIYTENKLGDLVISYMTYQKIFKKMGWKPIYDIFEGIKETLEFYQ
ncbi:UDP-glucose 4-epimerase [Clostridium ragsdalei P11]|uniref:UDP-glucose 4-epimerase n=1 Tax=Clostridium ragsdalei P11 TaxID=1353534 RepID=A0A1A6AI59_9CLOT|nr:NAD-dependent epimerase/dehydratase family protein [Clostridium ragsdalei]OBR89760.1 UDP-glucose 4-epimerase [Clostridium ragsdalei P11]